MDWNPNLWTYSIRSLLSVLKGGKRNRAKKCLGNLKFLNILVTFRIDRESSGWETHCKESYKETIVKNENLFD